MLRAEKKDRRNAIGPRIKRLREAKGLSRRNVAEYVKIDPTSVAAWEAGKYLPRDVHKAPLADLLGVMIVDLFAEESDGPAAPVSAILVDTMEAFPTLILELLGRTRRLVRDVRIAAPYGTPTNVQIDFRQRISARILNGTIEVQRVEIFYDLGRLKEVLSNILRYDGCAYHVKAYCSGLKEVVPGMGGYMFDDQEFVIGGYWTGVPPHGVPGLRLSGAPFSTYFASYWQIGRASCRERVYL